MRTCNSGVFGWAGDGTGCANSGRKTRYCTMVEGKTRVSPDMYAYVDENHTKINLEIALPGVKKEDITLKMHEDSFNLSASRADFEYVTALSFYCPVRLEKAEAKYEDGLLTVEVPFKDHMDEYVHVLMG